MSFKQFNLSVEIEPQISKASRTLGRLHNRVLNQHNICLSTKLKVYNAIFFPSLFYGCTVKPGHYHRQIKNLENFHMWALCYILGIWWQDCMEWKSTAFPDTYCTENLRVERDTKANQRNDSRTLSKPTFCWCNFKPKNLETCTADWPQWQVTVHQASSVFEVAWLGAKNSSLQKKSWTQQQQWSQPPSFSAHIAPDSTPQDWVCRITFELTDELLNEKSSSDTKDNHQI